MNHLWDFITLPDNTFEFIQILFLSAVKLSILLGFVHLLCLSFRRLSAAAKHFLWMLALCAGFLLPLSFAVKGWEIPILPAQTSLTNQKFQSISLEKVKGSERQLGDSAMETVPAEYTSPVSNAETFQQNNFPSFWNRAGHWIIGIWFAGAMLLLFRLVIGIVTANRYARRAIEFVNPVWTELALELSNNLNFSGKFDLLKSGQISMPVICGLRRSKILLPSDADTWSDERRRIVLLHELAHVKRRDCLTQVLAQIVCAFYWFNPLVWIAARHLRHLREQACDDCVLSAGIKPSDYAGHLLDVARSAQEKFIFNLFQTATIAAARKSQLEARLLAILDLRPNRRGLNRLIKASAIFIFAGIVLSLPALQLKSQANEPTSFKETVIGNEQESENNFFDDGIPDYTIAAQQNNLIEISKQTNGKRSQSRRLNPKESKSQTVKDIEVIALKTQKSGLNERENLADSDDESRLSLKEMSDKDARASGLKPLTGLKGNLDLLNKLKNDLKSNNNRVRQKAEGELDLIRAKKAFDN